MTIHILGLGESLKEYQPDGNLTIGVNDIHRFVKSDYVVCVDAPRAFSEERLSAIWGTRCKGFYSQCKEWDSIPNFNLMEFSPGRGYVDALDSDKFNYATSSPFVAIVLAYKLGAKEIVLHGVDMKTHKVLKDSSRDTAISHICSLTNELKKRDVVVMVNSNYSELASYLPLWKDKMQS